MSLSLEIALSSAKGSLSFFLSESFKFYKNRLNLLEMRDCNVLEIPSAFFINVCLYIIF